MSELQSGLASCKYHQGSLRVNRFNPFEGWVGSESVGQDILISGRQDMNRAVDGDIVVVELLPEAEWKAPSRVLPGRGVISGDGAGKDGGGSGEDGGGGSEEVPGDGEVEAAGAELFQVAQPEEGGAGLEGRQPTGRVVGVVKRSWRARGYAGSLKPQDVGAGGGTMSVLFVPVERRLPMIR
jgi:exosome complex exonuclease DIS3/RRP44